MFIYRFFKRIFKAKRHMTQEEMVDLLIKQEMTQKEKAKLYLRSLGF